MAARPLSGLVDPNADPTVDLIADRGRTADPIAGQIAETGNGADAAPAAGAIADADFQIRNMPNQDRRPRLCPRSPRCLKFLFNP
jgi:hypothetical protein